MEEDILEELTIWTMQSHTSIHVHNVMWDEQTLKNQIF